MNIRLSGLLSVTCLLAACSKDEPPRPAAPPATTTAAVAPSATTPADKPKPVELAWMKKLDGDMKDVIVKLGQLGASRSRRSPRPRRASSRRRPTRCWPS
jgi:hypothetical protein